MVVLSGLLAGFAGGERWEDLVTEGAGVTGKTLADGFQGAVVFLEQELEDRGLLMGQGQGLFEGVWVLLAGENGEQGVKGVFGLCGYEKGFQSAHIFCAQALRDTRGIIQFEIFPFIDKAERPGLGGLFGLSDQRFQAFFGREMVLYGKDEVAGMGFAAQGLEGFFCGLFQGHSIGAAGGFAADGPSLGEYQLVELGFEFEKGTERFLALKVTGRGEPEDGL